MAFPRRSATSSSVLLGACFICVVGCGSSQKEADSAHLFPDEGVQGGAGEPPAETIAAPLTELPRSRLVAAVDAGFVVFLQSVEVSASVVDGRFEGFRIVRFVEPEQWRGVGLQPGDVVKSVNDQAIERPEQAYAVFVSLKTAKNLDVAFLREGRPMRLSLPIVEDAPPQGAPGPASTPAPSAPPGPGPAPSP